MGLFNVKILKDHDYKSIIQETAGLKKQLIVSVNQLIQRQEKEYTGNRYQDYEEAVEEIDKKYKAESQWGSVLTGNIIDLRAAFVIMNGLKVRKKKDIQDEKTDAKADMTIKWIEEFLSFNVIDGIMVYQLASEAEIEGKVALWIKDNKEEEYPSIRFISWTNKKYTIETAPNDYLDYRTLKWKKDKQIENWTKLQYPDFVYNKFGGRMTEPNQACPVVMRCLTQIEDVDKAMTDWRMINNLFAAPVLHIDSEDPDQAKQIRDELLGESERASEVNWKLRKLFVTANTKMNLISPEMGGVDSLEKEMQSKLKLISGTTAIPIHYLGLLDLLKNRATGENTREMIIAGTTKARKTWEATWEEVIKKSIVKANNNESRQKYSENKKLDPDSFKVEIPVFTEEQWDHIEKVLLPLYLGNGISHRHLLSQIPDVNVESEIREKEENDNAMMPQFGGNEDEENLTSK